LSFCEYPNRSGIDETSTAIANKDRKKIIPAVKRLGEDLSYLSCSPSIASNKSNTGAILKKYKERINCLMYSTPPKSVRAENRAPLKNVMIISKLRNISNLLRLDVCICSFSL
jgi:hypothetical protein